MKTEVEVEKMKTGIEQEIQKLQDQISEVCDRQLVTSDLERLSIKKRHLMAQYNILLEVLK